MCCTTWGNTRQLGQQFEGHEVDVGAIRAERLEPTLATVSVAAFLGFSIVRVHDVSAAVRAAKVGDALRRARKEAKKTVTEAIDA